MNKKTLSFIFVGISLLVATFLKATTKTIVYENEKKLSAAIDQQCKICEKMEQLKARIAYLERAAAERRERERQNIAAARYYKQHNIAVMDDYEDEYE